MYSIYEYIDVSIKDISIYILGGLDNIIKKIIPKCFYRNYFSTRGLKLLYLKLEAMAYKVNFSL